MCGTEVGGGDECSSACFWAMLLSCRDEQKRWQMTIFFAFHNTDGAARADVFFAAHFRSVFIHFLLSPLTPSIPPNIAMCNPYLRQWASMSRPPS